MAPTSFDIFDLNDCFAVDPPAPLGSINDAFAVDEAPALRADSAPSCNDAFAVDEVLTPRAPSSPELVMPQFLIPELEPDSDGLIPSDCARREALTLAGPLNDLRTDGRQSVNPWDPRLTMDLALGVDATEEVLERYGLSKEEFEALCEVPAFRRELSTTIRELRENGSAYSEKCKAMSTMYLERIDQLIYDNATPASTIMDAIKWVGKMAKLEPKEDKGDSGGTSGTNVNLVINFANLNR